MSRIVYEYLKFYKKIGGRINKKGNFVPFEKEEITQNNEDNSVSWQRKEIH